MEIRPRLEKGAHQLELALNENQLDSFVDYLAMIQKWNKAYNLVGTSNADELIQKHLLDSLSILPYVKKSPVLDVGSGAGLPGIPLAISLPDISFTLVDSNGKKARFMRQVVMDLKLTNVDVVQTRIENYNPGDAPMTVLSRAFAPLEKALKMLTVICAPQGQVQLMLGVHPGEVPAIEGLTNVQVHTMTIPELHSQRHLLVADRV